MRGALSSFENEVLRIDAVAVWLVGPEALAPSMIPATIAVRCGATVLLSSYFETFLRDCIKSFIAQLNALNKPLPKLPEKMKYVHFESGARVLTREAKRARKSTLMGDCQDISARLASLSANSGYTLLWEAFADTQANPNAEVVGALLGSLGVKRPWKKIEGVVVSGLGNLQLFLDSLIALRNECAHSASTAAPPTPNDLVDYGIRLLAIAKAIVEVLEKQLVDYAAL